jgi:UDP-glucose:tetrahydrobiopterin glucosyltransferase
MAAKKYFFKPEMCDTLIEMGKIGASQKMMWSALGISKDVAEDWKKKYPDFADALGVALVHSQAYWEREMLANVGNKAFNSRIAEIALSHPRHLAFHTAAQAADFDLPQRPVLVGNGFDLTRYGFTARPDALLGWAGRIAPEKGLEDAAAVAARLELPLAVWGLEEDQAYARWVEASVPPGTLQWRGFLPTERLQAELGRCAVLLNTPKWNEAFGNVVVEAMACGVPVAAYARGGPAELVQDGMNGALAVPDDLEALAVAVQRARQVSRADCRRWVEQHYSQQAFAARLEDWLQQL